MGNYLPAPDKAKEGVRSGESELASFGSCGMRGWRNRMEDAHVATLDFLGEKFLALFAVFDGHGGRQVAAFAKEKLTDAISNSPNFQSALNHLLNGKVNQSSDEPLNELTDQLTVTSENIQLSMKQAMVDAYLTIDGWLSDPNQQIYEHPEKSVTPRTMWSGVGCTACSVLLYSMPGSSSKFMAVANAGDSRAVLCKEGIAVPLTADHKPNDPEEKKRIEAAGCVVKNNRVNMSLNLSRSLGDFAYKDKSLPAEKHPVTALPDVQIYPIDSEKDEFIVIACDGVWEICENQEVVDFVKTRMISLKAENTGKSATDPQVGPKVASAGEAGEEIPPGSTTDRATTGLTSIAGQLLDYACSSSIREASGLGLDNLTCIIVDLRPQAHSMLPDSPNKPVPSIMRRTFLPSEESNDDEEDDDEIDA